MSQGYHLTIRGNHSLPANQSVNLLQFQTLKTEYQQIMIFNVRFPQTSRNCSSCDIGTVIGMCSVCALHEGKHCKLKYLLPSIIFLILLLLLDQLIEEPKTSPLTSGVLFTMAIPLCFIVCFLVLCYIKGPGKEKHKEGGISGRLVESVSPFLDTAFLDPKDTNGESKSKRKSVTTKNSTFSEEEPMV